jgi:hypothetical protein
MMMPRPTLIHQRIASNLERYLTDVLDATRPSWSARREIAEQAGDIVVPVIRRICKLMALYRRTPLAGQC